MARMSSSASPTADATPLVLKLQGGRAPFRWLANGKPLTAIERRRTATWQPDGAGYSDADRHRRRRPRRQRQGVRGVRAFRRMVWPAIAILAITTLPAIAADLPAGFVRLADVDATIRQDMRYAGSANFLGRPAKGYEAPACILTTQAAEALSKVQKSLAAENLTLVVFDCYRPDRAVEGFCRLGPGIEIEGPALAPECQAQRPDPAGLHRQPLRPFARLDRRPRHRAGDDAARP